MIYSVFMLGLVNINKTEFWKKSMTDDITQAFAKEAQGQTCKITRLLYTQLFQTSQPSYTPSCFLYAVYTIQLTPM